MDSDVIILEDTPASPTEPDVEVIGEDINYRGSWGAVGRANPDSFTRMSLSNVTRVRVETDDSKSNGELGIGFVLDRSGLHLPNPLFKPNNANKGEDRTDATGALSPSQPEEPPPVYDIESEGAIRDFYEDEVDEQPGDICKNMNKKGKSLAKCFNCGLDHMISDCPEPKDPKTIAKNVRLFRMNDGNSGNKNCRYHQDLEQKYSNFVPGELSRPVLEAMGLKYDQLPRHIYNMRYHGYPPGWKEWALEQSTTLRLYGNTVGLLRNENRGAAFNPDKVYGFPGFNLPIPSGVFDECKKLYKPAYNPKYSRDNFIRELEVEFEHRKRKYVPNRNRDLYKDDRDIKSRSPPCHSGQSHSRTKRDCPSAEPVGMHPTKRRRQSEETFPQERNYTLGRGQKIRMSNERVEMRPTSSSWVDVHGKNILNNEIPSTSRRSKLPNEKIWNSLTEDPYESVDRRHSVDYTSNRRHNNSSFHKNSSNNMDGFGRGNQNSGQFGDRNLNNRGGRNRDSRRQQGNHQYRGGDGDRESNYNHQNNQRNNKRGNSGSSSERWGRQTEYGDYTFGRGETKWNDSPLVPKKRSKIVLPAATSRPPRKLLPVEDVGYPPESAPVIMFRPRTPSPSLFDNEVVDASPPEVMLIDNSPASDDVVILSPNLSPKVTDVVIVAPQTFNPIEIPIEPFSGSRRIANKFVKKKEKEENWEDDASEEEEEVPDENDDNSETDDESIIFLKDEEKVTKTVADLAASSTPTAIAIANALAAATAAVLAAVGPVSDNISPMTAGASSDVDDDDEMRLLIDESPVIVEEEEEVHSEQNKFELKSAGQDESSASVQTVVEVTSEESLKNDITKGAELPLVYIYKNSFAELPSLDKFAVGMHDLLLHETDEEHTGRFDKVLSILQKKKIKFSL